MTEDILRDVVTTKTAWDILNRMFASASRARVVQIRVELATTKKCDLSTDDYFRKIKSLASEMAAIDAPLRDDEVVAYLLASLDVDYDSFVTSMTTKSEALTLDVVYGDLMSYEARQLQHQAEVRLLVGNSANYVGRGGTPGRGGACGAHGGPPRGPPRGPHRGGAAPSRGRGTSYSRDNPSHPQCQIYGKIGHTTLKCWYCMDDAYQEDPHSAAVATTSSYQIDLNWYSDTRATDHITSDLDRLAMCERYNGQDTVQVGNGAGLQIMHLGSCSINTNTRSLALNNVLHVPEIFKHLLFVHKLARDNNIFFKCHPWYFFINDRATRSLLLEGQCESGLYPLKPADVVAIKQAFLSFFASLACLFWSPIYTSC
jgi:hypothetical protein